MTALERIRAYVAEADRQAGEHEHFWADAVPIDELRTDLPRLLAIAEAARFEASDHDNQYLEPCSCGLCVALAALEDTP